MCAGRAPADGLPIEESDGEPADDDEHADPDQGARNVRSDDHLGQGGGDRGDSGQESRDADAEVGHGRVPEDEGDCGDEHSQVGDRSPVGPVQFSRRGRPLDGQGEHGEHRCAQPDGVHRNPPGRLATQHRDSAERETRLACQRDRSPGNPLGVGAPAALNEDAAHRHDRGGHDNPGEWTLSFEQRSEHAEQHRDTGHRDGDDRRLGMLDTADDRDVEQDEAGRRDSGEPQPLTAARADDTSPADASHHQQENCCGGIPHRLCGEQRCVRQDLGDGDAATHERHPCGAKQETLHVSQCCCETGPVNRSSESSLDRAIPSGSDFLQLDVARAPVGGLSAWLAEEVRLAASDGRLPVGSRLPPSRLLASELQVSRGVVTEAYQRLIDEGRVEGRGRGGTVVVAAPLERAPAGGPVAADPVLAGEVFGAGRSPGPEVFDALRTAPARIDLSPGVPDLAAFPRAAWLRAERTVLADLSPSAFGYGDPRGAPRFRRAVATWLARNRGIRVDPDEVVVVAGVAQALGLLGQVLRGDGMTRIATEEPGSLGTRQHLWNAGLETPPVPVDEQGLLVREIDAPAVLVTPAHHFPTGVVLSGERRRELLQWAEDGGLVIEDDYDAEHRYDRPPVPALRSALAEQVCYAGSVSKLLAPALRVGWLVVPRRYAEAVVSAKRFADLGNAVLPQLVLAELMDSGALERHLRLVRRRHRRRRDAMIGALREHVPDARVHGAAAGLHLTVTFDSDIDDVALAAAALERGVKVQPLAWHYQRPGSPGLVLGYAANTTSAIADGIATLGSLSRN